LFDVHTGHAISELRQKIEQPFTRICFGTQYVLSAQDAVATVWERRTGAPKKTIRGDALISALAIGPDEKVAATGSDDGTVRVFNISTGEEVARMGHANAIGAVAFSPDGRYVASGGADHLVRIWPWRDRDLTQLACDRLARNLTQDEWNKYLGTPRYRKTCPALP
jgi:WD40 repeat protein